MTAPGFAELVARLLEAMGLQMDSAREVPEGLLLRTGDGFLFAFLEDPNEISLGTVQGLIVEAGPNPAKLVVVTPGRLPLALATEVARANGTIVEGARFQELVRSLDLGPLVGQEPRAEVPHPARRLLPSAQQLDQIMQRARTWLDWGVPALALRFYRQAAGLKPGFAPARVGIGRSLLALGLLEDAQKALHEALTQQPGDVDARVGLAAARGAAGHVDEEIRAYRDLLAEGPSRVEVRTHLIAALVSQNRWAEARTEIEVLLGASPEDPQLRFLRAVTLEKTGAADEGRSERETARRLGLDLERERALCAHLGLPDPQPRTAGPARVGPLPERPAHPRGAKAPRARAPSKRAAPKRRTATKSRSSRARKRK